MKLILKENVPNLGEAGDIVTVKAGYGRNYLLPQGLAYAASEANLKRLEEEARQKAERARRDKLEAGRRAAQLSGAGLTFHARAAEGEEGRLFGSVTAADIADRLNAEGGLDFEVEKRWIQLEDPIKELGDHPVTVRLHQDVEAEITVQVEREDG